MKNWLVIGACTLAIACGESTRQDTARKNGFTAPELKTKEDSLYHEIMDGHDVGMAKMSKLGKATKGVTDALDSIARIPAKKADTTYRNALTDLQKKLSYAEYGMDTWMKEFNPDSAKDNNELRLQYLESERDKVNMVKKNILESLQLADSLLKKQ